METIVLWPRGEWKLMQNTISSITSVIITISYFQNFTYFYLRKWNNLKFFYKKVEFFFGNKFQLVSILITIFHFIQKKSRFLIFLTLKFLHFVKKLFDGWFHFYDFGNQITLYLFSNSANWRFLKSVIFLRLRIYKNIIK